MPRTRKLTPADKRRKAKRAEKRIEENSNRRTRLTQQMGGAAVSEKPMKVWREQRDARIPARLEIARLTGDLAEDFDEHRDNKAGSIPVPPKGPIEMREENTRHRKPKRRGWKGA